MLLFIRLLRLFGLFLRNFWLFAKRPIPVVTKHIMVHGEWVDHLFYEVEHLGFHIDQQIKRELKGGQ